MAYHRLADGKIVINGPESDPSRAYPYSPDLSQRLLPGAASL